MVGDDFLVKFLQNYELEEDMKMLLEMPANGATEMAGKEDGSQAPSQGRSVSLGGLADHWGGANVQG